MKPKLIPFLGVDKREAYNNNDMSLAMYHATPPFITRALWSITPRPKDTWHLDITAYEVRSAPKVLDPTPNPTTPIGLKYAKG